MTVKERWQDPEVGVPFIQLLRGPFFNWSGVGLNKPWASIYNLCIFKWGSHFRSHACNRDTFTCDSALQSVCSHCWHIFNCPLMEGWFLVICASVSQYVTNKSPCFCPQPVRKILNWRSSVWDLGGCTGNLSVFSFVYNHLNIRIVFLLP